MNPETPLPEVAHILPTEAATVLMYEAPTRQEAILHVVRRCVVEWEQRGVVTDPITLGVVLNSLVREVLGVVRACEQMINEDFLPKEGA